jgi:hypothetical protein
MSRAGLKKRIIRMKTKGKKMKLKFLVVTLVILFFSGCANEGKKFAEVVQDSKELVEIRQIMKNIAGGEWPGPLNGLKDKLEEQSKRLESGIMTGMITKIEAKDIIYEIRIVLNKIINISGMMKKFGENPPSGGMEMTSKGMRGPPPGMKRPDEDITGRIDKLIEDYENNNVILKDSKSGE